MSVPSKNITHVAEAVKLPTSMFRERRVIKMLIAVAVKQLQLLENETWKVIEGRTLDGSVGVQLDMLGALVGEKRDGRSDVDYVEAIKLRILINRSTGKVHELIKIMTVAADGNECKYFDWPAANYGIIFAGTFAAVKALVRAVSEADPQGVSGCVFYSEASLDLCFTFGHSDGSLGSEIGDVTSGDVDSLATHVITTRKVS